MNNVRAVDYLCILLLFEFKTHDQNNDTNGFYMFLVA